VGKRKRERKKLSTNNRPCPCWSEIPYFNSYRFKKIKIQHVSILSEILNCGTAY
jgi:hypothetical protein